MMPLSIIIILAMLIASSGSAAAFTQEETPARRNLTIALPEANDDIDIVYMFTRSRATGFAAGVNHKLLLGFRNSGVSSVSVSQISGSLNAPQQFSFYVENFTEISYMTVVEPDKEASFEYMFSLEPQHAGHTYTLCFTVFYSDIAEKYATTFFNTTVAILDPGGFLDAQTFFMYVLLVGIASCSLHYGMKVTGTLSYVVSLVEKFADRGTRLRQDTSSLGKQANDEWLRGTSWTTFKTTPKKRK